MYQIGTLDGWTQVMYNLEAWSSTPLIPRLFCVSLVFLISFFLLNLMLAVVMESYEISEEREFEKLRKEAELEKQLFEERMKILPILKINDKESFVLQKSPGGSSSSYKFTETESSVELP